MSQATVTLDEVALRLNCSAKDIEAAVSEVLNKKAAVMLSEDEMERLETHFREQKHSKDTKSRRGGRLTMPNNVRRATKGPAGNVLIERRKMRGKASQEPPPKQTATEQQSERKEPQAVPAVIVKTAPTLVVDDHQTRQKREQERKLLESIHAKNQRLPVVVTEQDKELDDSVTTTPDQPTEEVLNSKSDSVATATVNERRTTLTVAKETVEHRKRKNKRRRVQKSELRKQEFRMPQESKALEVELPEQITPRELANRMSVKVDKILAKLAEVEDDVDDVKMIEQEAAAFIVGELGHKPVKIYEDRESEYLTMIKQAKGSNIISRPPVVTVMGHVDHGKTSLLDYIRKSKVTATESGGITQHIGAHQVQTPGGKITFIDTPGHEVFSEMRARGAHVTDIVVLVVAADDGVGKQTEEAINHARAAGVTIVVAINKIDLATADPEAVKQALASQGLQSEEWGGDIIMVPVSATTGEGIDKLLEAILLTAEIMELQAPLDVDAYGTVIEVRTEKGLGPVISGIVHSGVLRKGQFLLCDTEYGRIRALRDEAGVVVDEVGPSTPVQIQGIPDLPAVGCEFVVATTESEARDHAEERKQRIRMRKLTSNTQLHNDANDIDELFEMSDALAERKVLNLILKTDVAGTNEAMQQALAKIGNDDACIKVIHSGVGAISESDVMLACASDSMLVGYRVTANNKARKLISDRQVSALFDDVFYNVTDHIKSQLEGMLKPIVEEQVRGIALIKEIFNIHKVGRIAGCAVTEGQFDLKLPVRIVRDGVVVNKTHIAELRHFKEKVDAVKSGSECGIYLKRFSDFKPGDVIESVEEIVKKQQL